MINSQNLWARRSEIFFASRYKKYGRDDLRSVVWNSGDSQRGRFEILSQVGDLRGRTILDVGSGLGHLYEFLLPLKVVYTGIEVVPEFVKSAKERYPGANFIEGDFLTCDFNGKYDYVLCSGALNIEVVNYKDYLEAMIKRMFYLASWGLAFNLPSSYAPEKGKGSTFEEGVKIKYSRPERIFSYCKRITPWVSLRHDYFPHDFTIYIYHKRQV